MEKNDYIRVLEDLSNANGVSGFEDEVAALLRERTSSYGEVSEDSLRNVYVRRHENTGDRPLVMLEAHSDEVGFIVQAILPNGMIRFLSLGRWVESNVPAHRVRVRNIHGDFVMGLIASKPPHFTSAEDLGKTPKLSEMVIDVGSTSYEDTVEKFGIRIGAPIVPDVTFRTLDHQEDWFVGKGFDCRIGCAAEVMALDLLAGEDLAVDVTGVFSSQEEVGTRGIKVSVGQVKPDLAICFEGCPADDTFSEPYMIQTAVGKGPMLRHFDVSMITNPRFQRYALDLAAEKGIPCQDSVRSGGGTDGSVIHLAENGIPCIVIGVPVRYVHTHYGISCYSDMAAAAELAAEICREMTVERIGGF